MDKQSGKDFNRKQYRELIYKKLKSKDVLVIKSIDRLGRNYEEILTEWKHITNEIEADIVVLDMPILDTRRNNDLTGTLISDIVLQILSYVAQNERENISQRQAEGIALAKARGVRFGRPRKPVPPVFFPLYRKWKNKEMCRKDIENELGISKMKFYRLVKMVETSSTSIFK